MSICPSFVSELRVRGRDGKSVETRIIANYIKLCFKADFDDKKLKLDRGRLFSRCFTQKKYENNIRNE